MSLKLAGHLQATNILVSMGCCRCVHVLLNETVYWLWHWPSQEMQVTLCLCPRSRGATLYTPRDQCLPRVWAFMYTCLHLQGGVRTGLLRGKSGGTLWRGEVGLLCSVQAGGLRLEYFIKPFLLQSSNLHVCAYRMGDSTCSTMSVCTQVPQCVLIAHVPPAAAALSHSAEGQDIQVGEYHLRQLWRQLG